MNTRIAVNQRHSTDGLTKTLLGLVMSSVCVVANAADSSASNSSFTIKIIETAPAKTAGQSGTKADPLQYKTVLPQATQRTSREPRADPAPKRWWRDLDQ